MDAGLLNNLNPVLQMLIVMSVFSLLPFVFCCMTSFLRFVIVFSMLKTAMGTQQVPPSIVIIGLSMILTFFTMGNTFQKTKFSNGLLHLILKEYTSMNTTSFVEY